MGEHDAWSRECEVTVDMPRWSFIKRNDAGAVDFVSPLPCPFNYGSLPGTRSGDGERIDAVVLGPRLSAGTRLRLPVLAVVRFVDAGDEDPKWVCGPHPVSPGQRAQLVAFFRVYALAKGALNRARGKSGATRYEGLELGPPQ